jgi:hypothetical protein
MGMLSEINPAAYVTNHGLPNQDTRANTFFHTIRDENEDIVRS